LDYTLPLIRRSTTSKIGKPAVKSIVKEIIHMHSKGVWSGVKITKEEDLSFKRRKTISISSSLHVSKGEEIPRRWYDREAEGKQQHPRPSVQVPSLYSQ